jgi:6-phosphogluconolactonase
MIKSRPTWFCCLLLALWCLPSAGRAAEGASPAAAGKRAEHVLVYVGTYTGGQSKGIYSFRLDLASGQVTPGGVTTGVVSPSFLAIHPSGRFLYAANEVGNFAGKKSGSVSAFAIEAETGNLTFLNRQPSGGAAPCHLVVDRSGRNVLVANYTGGSVAVLRVGEDGRLGKTTAFVQHRGSSVHPRRQKGPHAHSINLDASNRFSFVADLGLDRVLVYRFDAAGGTLAPHETASVSVAPGAGPRHFAFHPDGRHAYVINELNSTVTAFAYRAEDGTLKELQTVSTLPAGFDGRNTTAEIQVAPGGKFLYGSNRGHDSIAVFAIDPGRGTLTCVEHESTGGKTPRNFGIDPTGAYLLAANQNSGTVVLFRIDSRTGRLEPTGGIIRVPQPVCVKFLRPAG